MRLESKYKYKMAMKRAELQPQLDFDDELSNYYATKDTNSFYRAMLMLCIRGTSHGHGAMGLCLCLSVCVDRTFPERGVVRVR